jgi:radical SAM superfamily enzyme YgiQ (UPF0313 family)
MNMTGADAIADAMKEISPELSIVLTGLHVTALPERSLAESKADFVCQGEGFYTLPSLIQAILASADVSSIPGLWYRKDGRITSGQPALLMEDLDTLPMPAWDLLPIEKYRAHNWHCFDNIDDRQPYAVINTSLGCPFKCSFCCINALFGKSGIRLRSPEKVVAEIEFLQKRFGVRNIKIVDEMFAFNKAHVRKICDLIVERGLDLNMWAYARVNTVNREMLAAMRKAGIRWVAYGFESGSEKVLKGVSKGYRPEAALEIAKLTYEEGLYINGNYIFGLPDDDLATMQETLDLAQAVNSEWVNLYSTMAYPGSRLYDEALAEGLALPKKWEDYSQYGYQSTPLATKNLTGKEVLGFRDRAFQQYYTRPEYLAMMEAKFGSQTRAHIEAMTTKSLPRQ